MFEDWKSHILHINMGMKYYVYAYTNPLKTGVYKTPLFTFLYEPIYVGKGTGLRHDYHLSRNDVHPLTHKINKIRSNGSEPDITIIEYFDDEEDAYDLEETLITSIGFGRNGPLCNLCSGGLGGRQRIVADETREKLRVASTGKTISSNARRKISNALSVIMKERHSNSPASEETRDKISKRLKSHYQNNGGVVYGPTGKGYTLISPSGEVFNIDSVKQFCKERTNGIGYRSLYRNVGKGVISKGTYSGWSIDLLDRETL